jgi:hypothetical protein
VLAHINNTCTKLKASLIPDLSLSSPYDTEEFRRILGLAAKKYDWFKDISRAEAMTEIVSRYLDAVPGTPLVASINRLRQWIDGQ